ncbi:sodium:solute symporter family protein [Roseibacillus persicicus]|uniref:Sodium/glucose cotransporter n=1 Tax=Roseibacillus persicicus TaxID=454148 RepID=A0A918TU32_9BACT|nr:sodium:solute symporter family protein [Roseibacillus persicicus]MDQ8189804.1 Na+:solute symporter [Roseibacillus persicicus]GHC62027.1 sodium/glucose cotransporter [Roseibacillus persicicus]
MNLQTIDWVIIAVFFVIVIGIGYVASRTAGKSTQEFFLGGRHMPWWLLGISMVACTFSADTPNLVTGMVRENGVAKNWAWWAFLITGMVTVFIYAKLWRRSEVMTDLEYYELRYHGKAAAFLRGFRSLFLGLFFNLLIMATVTLAIIKYGQILFGIEAWQCVVFGSIGVVIYATLGGLKGVIWADFFQYSIAMFGAIYAAYISIQQPEVQAIGGLSGLVGAESPIASKLAILPDPGDLSLLVSMLIIPVAVQWWAVWYPGAEPGGGGYIAQRMLSAKDEKNAIGATLLFNFMHYAIRPWPWIIVALASLIVFPELDDIRQAFPGIDEEYLAHDVAYPAMISKLGPGVLGIVIASIIAAYMSTIGTHLNWGSSYLVNDFYSRFVKKDASQKHLVAVGRVSTVVLMVGAGFFALQLKSATQAFDLLLLSGAGTGSIYLLRWFWWRVNAITEIVAMISAIVVGIVLVFVVDPASLALSLGGTPDAPTLSLDGNTVRLLLAVLINTVVWVTTTFLTKPEPQETLFSFYRKTRPGGPGWAKLRQLAEGEGVDIEGESKGQRWELPYEIACVFIGTIMVYACLFSIGNFVYGNLLTGVALGLLAVGSCYGLFRVFAKSRSL